MKAYNYNSNYIYVLKIEVVMEVFFFFLKGCLNVLTLGLTSLTVSSPQNLSSGAEFGKIKRSIRLTAEWKGVLLTHTAEKFSL